MAEVCKAMYVDSALQSSSFLTKLERSDNFRQKRTYEKFIQLFCSSYLWKDTRQCQHSEVNMYFCNETGE